MISVSLIDSPDPLVLSCSYVNNGSHLIVNCQSNNQLQSVSYRLNFGAVVKGKERNIVHLLSVDSILLKGVDLPFSIPLSELSTGKNQLVISATDVYGDSATATISIQGLIIKSVL